MKQSDGFRGYYVFGTGDGIAGSVTLFDSEDAATAANEKAMIWIRASLSDLIDGEPEVTAAGNPRHSHALKGRVSFRTG